MTIVTNRLQKIFQVLHEKNAKRNIVYCDYNDISMIYINLNMAPLRVRNLK